MDRAGFSLMLVEIVGAAFLVLVILFLVLKARGKDKQVSNERTEQATRDLYRDEQAAHENEPGSGL